MTIGLLKWFDKINGFGIIGTPDKGDFFLHESNLKIHSNSLEKGTPLCFNEKVERKRNAAKNCRLIESLDDLELVLKYLSKKDTVPVEVVVRGESRWGNSYKRKEINDISLIKVSLKKIKEKVNEDELYNFLKIYYSTDLDYNYFIDYCEFINKVYPRISSLFIRQTKRNNSNEELSPNRAKLLFEYFGENLNEQVLFEVWRAKKNEFIGRNKDDDYEISREALVKFNKSFSVSDLERILNYEYGEDLVFDLVKQKIENSEGIEWSTRDYLKIVNKLSKTKSDDLTEKFYEKLERKTKDNIISKAKNIGDIDSENSLQTYNRLKNIIPYELSEQAKSKLKELVDKLIVDNAESKFKVELWLKGFEVAVPEDEIKLKFKQNEATVSQKKTILMRAESGLKEDLICEYFIKERPVKGFELIELLLEEMNSFGYSFSLKKTIFNEDFWADKKGGKILQRVKELVDEILTPEENYALFFLGLSNNFPSELIKHEVLNLNQTEFEKISEFSQCTNQFLFNLLQSYLESENILKNIDWVYSIAKERLSAISFKEFDNLCFLKFDESDYFKLWGKGKGKIIPKQTIISLLDENTQSYSIISEWKKYNIISGEDLSSLLLENLHSFKKTEDRKTFYQVYNHIKAIIDYQIRGIEEIKEMESPFNSLLLWFFDKESSFDFDLLKSKFIYFNPNDQVKVIKKVFQQIHNRTIQLTIEELNEIMRIDIDLYKTNQNFSPEIPLDISTDIVIKSILNYKEKGKFLVESELLKIVLHDLFGDKKRKFKIRNYFEKCQGRLTAEFDWSKNGEISKIPFGDNKYYYCIQFDYDPDLVEKVRIIPGRKYNKEKRHWGVPSKYTSEVLQFAKDNRFFLNFEGSNYSNNVHLAEFKRSEVPRGVTFCDGRVSNKNHYGRKFWLCANQRCFQNCETVHNIDEWENYTLLDFLLILGFNVDETKSNPDDFVSKGEYYKFISLLNRFNRLLEKIYCVECEEILYPVQSSHFAAYTVVKFCCENNVCSKHKEVVYLNHCLNGKCNSIIDSRVSKKCPNGLYICETCGSCCSHSFFKRRKENLETADNFDNEQKVWIYNDTKRKFDNKLGHLERADYFCHKDGQQMAEVKIDIFECDCGNKYDTTSYRIKRIHRGLEHHSTNDDNEFPDELAF